MAIAYHAQIAPLRAAVLSERGNRSFAELNAIANQFARFLLQQGLNAGDAVALMCSNRPEFVEVYAACLRSGLRLTSVNWHLTAREAAHIIHDSDAKVLVIDERVLPIAGELRGLIDKSVRCVIMDGEHDGYSSYAAALDGQASEDIEHPSLGGFFFYTSGTTGQPKGVVRASRPTQGGAVLAPMAPGLAGAASSVPPTVAAALQIRHAPYEPGVSCALCTGPLYHAAPAVYSLGTPLNQGVTIVLMDRWTPEATLSLIERYKISHVHVVATMFHRLLALPADERTRWDISSLRFVLHGAAPTGIELKRAMLDWLGPIIFEYYAGSEGGGTAIGPHAWLAKPGSVGKAEPLELVRIVDHAGAVQPAGCVGRVHFATPREGGFSYYKDPAKTEAAYCGSYFTLGDDGYVDDDGYLFLTGRSSEIIISGGVNIYPVEVDSALHLHRAVFDAAVVGVPNPEYGEEVKAVVQLRSGFVPSEALAEELIVHCRSRLAHYKCPKSVDFVDVLPRSEAGKVRRRAVRERYWVGLGRAI